jgi:transcriptional regulator with GAF, ATPase, and Fis domain
MDTTSQRQAPAALPTRQLALRLLFSGEAGIVMRPPYLLSEPVVQVGRGLDGSGLLLTEDRQVSRLHATLHHGADGLRIVDEGSRNGTFVNGRRVSARSAATRDDGPPASIGDPLADGDVIRIGDSFLLVREEPVLSQDAAIPELIGRSPALRALRVAIKQVAPSSAMVLLLGESGTGKEVAARAIHSLSGRGGPFVAVNCSAIPETLAESQLFGHVRGAFTGANPHPGLFRSAEGGTLFLDEVGELTPALQPKLLRALEERAVLPVGATAPVACNVRIIAATNRALAQEARGGAFRGDLLSRLSEFILPLPPLRQRREDILLLCEHAFRQEGGTLPRLHPDLVEHLLLYDWPYNVRELLKTLSELRIRGAELPVLGPDLIAARRLLHAEEPTPATAPPPALRTPEAPREPVAGSRARAFERGPVPTAEALRALLVKHRGVVADIAKEVNRSRAQIYRWLEQRGLDPDEFRFG